MKRNSKQKKLEKCTRIVAILICVAMVLGIVIPLIIGA